MLTDTTSKKNSDDTFGWHHLLQKKVVVILLLGFSSGLPFPLVYSTLSTWLADSGIELSTVSTFAWLGFAYSFKFLWAPLVDTVSIPVLTRVLGRRRAWMLVAQIFIVISLFVLSGTDPRANIEVFALVAAAVALSSATQDIVVDAYRIECAESRMQGVLAAAYQYGYRTAMVVSTAFALVIAAHASWEVAYIAMAGCALIGVATTLWCNEPVAVVRKAAVAGSNSIEKVAIWFAHAVVDPFTDFVKRYGPFAFVMLAFISFYRLSDYVLGILANPFYIDIGYSLDQIALIAKGYGLWVGLVGIGLGGWGVVKFGVSRCLVIATILIASTNLFFAAMVIVGPEPWMLAVTISADNIAQGFSGTVLIAYLSSLTSLSFTATQYALLSSFMSLLGKFSAGFSGNVQESIGWLGFFLYATALGIPAIILAFVVAKRHDKFIAPT